MRVPAAISFPSFIPSGILEQPVKSDTMSITWIWILSCPKFTLNWLRFLCLPKDKTSITLTFAILYFILLSCLPCPFCPQYLPLLTGMQNRWTKIFACLDLGGFYIFSTRCLPSSRLHWPPRVAFFSSQRHQIPKLDPMPSGDFLSNFGRNCWRFFVHNWTLCHQVIFWLQL